MTQLKSFTIDVILNESSISTISIHSWNYVGRIHGFKYSQQKTLV